MKTHTLQLANIFIVCALCSLFFAPGTSTAQVINPIIWLRAGDYAANATHWHAWPDTSKYALAMPGGTGPSLALMNYNNALRIDGSFAGFDQTIDKIRNVATIYYVYHPDTALTENLLWQLRLNQDKKIQLTSKRLNQVWGHVDFLDSLSTGPRLSSTFIGWSPVPADSLGVSLRFAGSDSLKMSGNIAELVVFDKRLHGFDDMVWQTYLALKYGITLYHADYVCSNGDTLWRYAENKDFCYNIAGIGRDTILGLNQNLSGSFDDILSIGTATQKEVSGHNPSRIKAQDYLIWASNGKDLLPVNTPGLEDTNVNAVLERAWRVQPSSNTARNIHTQLFLDGSNIPAQELNKSVLLIDPSGIGDFAQPGIHYIYPDSVDADQKIYYPIIRWDKDKSGYDVFTFAFLVNDSITPVLPPPILPGNGKSAAGTIIDENISLTSKGNTYRVYPNPSKGNYRLDIQCDQPTAVKVEVFDLSGRLYQSYTGEGSDEYLFSKHIATPGFYQLRITTSSQNETLQLVIQ